MVESYLREECECLLYLSRNLVPDLKSVAIEWSPGSTAKVSETANTKVDSNSTKLFYQLVQAVFVAAMYSPKSNERMVKVMESLGTKVALPLANAIAEMQELDKRLAEQTISTEPNTNNSSSLGSNNGIGRDPELESEEKLIQAHASIKKLEGENIEQATQLKALRNHTSDLERQMNEAKNKIEAQQHGVSEGQALKDLKAKYARDKDYIAELETDMDSSRAVLEARQRELERLKADATNKQDLRDEIQVLKIERDELMSKAKANENLRKKIESLQNEEKRNQELQKQLQASNESLEQFVEIEKTCEILRKARAESQKTIANQEVEIFHIKDTKKRVENELEILARELRDTTGQISSYEEIIADLQARLNEMESEQAGKGIGLGNLDEEIVRKELEDELRQRQAIIYWQRGLINYSKLNDVKKPENFSISNDTNAAHLQQKLDALHKRNSKMETDFLETANENRGLRNLVKTTTEDQEAEYQTFKKHFGDAAANWPDSDTPFSRQQNALHAARQEAQDYKEKYLDTMSKLSDIQARWATSVDSSESTERVHRYTKSLDVKSGQRKISADESSLASSGVAVTNAGKGSDAGDKVRNGEDSISITSLSSTCSVLPASYIADPHSNCRRHGEPARNSLPAAHFSPNLAPPKSAHIASNSAQKYSNVRRGAISSETLKLRLPVNISKATASSSSASSPSSSPPSPFKKHTGFRASVRNSFISMFG